MNPISFSTKKLSSANVFILMAVFLLPTAIFLPAQTANPIPVFKIEAGQITAHVSPQLYGLMTEEINFSYEGGLYGELIRNRTFKANPTSAIYWNSIGGATISLDTNEPLNSALDVSLKLDTSKASDKSPAGIANGGYWGIPVKPKTTYHASFYAKGDGRFSGPLNLAIVSTDGKTVFASAQVKGVTGEWQKFEVTLKTKNVKPTKDAQFTLSSGAPGTIWLQQISLFPPTYNNRPNGNRIDLMQLLADMKPKFLRFPGGNYLEGDYFNERFDWKKTIGDISQRPGHRSPWNYWSTDGFGLMEFLEWCEDLHMEPLLAVNAGYALKHDYIKPGPDLEPFVQDALDEIEYVIGDANTKWGARRAKDGHPAPFKLNYVEVGNEDWFDRSGSYDGRFAQFYDAIKSKYPQLQIISSIGNERPVSQRVNSRKPDLVDEHYYRSARHDMESHANDYDRRKRDGGSKIFVGEWATRIGSPTPNLSGALGDAAWMAGMERNSDLIIMECYAPLFVNVSDVTNANRAERSMQWPSDLIGYDALASYGSPSYYAQVMFSNHHGDEVLATTNTDVPILDWQPAARRRNGVEEPLPPKQKIPTLFFNATRDSKTKTIYLKIVNCADTAQPVNVKMDGVDAIKSKGSAVVMKADNWDDTNSIQDPKKIVPVTEKVKGLGTNFTRTFPPYSITILELKTK